MQQVLQEERRQQDMTLSCHAAPGSLAILFKRNPRMPVCLPRDTIALEHLAWVVYDNQLAPGRSPALSGLESYGQVLQHLVDQAFV